MRLPAKCEPSQIWGAVFYTRWVLITGIALALFSVLLLVFELPFRADPDDPRKISSGLTEFTLHYDYGQVVNIERYQSTIVWNDVYVNPYGGVSASAGSSTTTTQYAIVVSPTGDVNSVLLSGMRVNIGYDLYSLWAIPKGHSAGPFVLHVNCFNHTPWSCPALAACTKLDWTSWFIFAILQGILFRWFAIFTIPVSALFYAIIVELRSESHKERLVNHIAGKILPGTVPGWNARPAG